MEEKETLTKWDEEAMMLIMDEAVGEAVDEVVDAVVVVVVVVPAVEVATTHRIPRCLLLPAKINMLQYH